MYSTAGIRRTLRKVLGQSPALCPSQGAHLAFAGDIVERRGTLGFQQVPDARKVLLVFHRRQRHAGLL